MTQLQYTRRKRGNLFWEPTKAMRAKGFLPKPLGPESPDSVAEAKRLYAAWQKVLAEGDRREPAYPPGTFGSFWEKLRGTKEQSSPWWAAKKPRTREDYERAWAYVEAWAPKPGAPTLARTVIYDISTNLCEQFYAHLEETASVRERWRAIKGLKILLDQMVVRLRLGYASPAAKLVNPQPAGRSAFWLATEIEDLAAGSAILGFEGMSLAVDIAWETMFSPIDVWSLRPRQLKRDTTGWYIHRERSKTDKEAFAAVSDDLGDRLQAYLVAQGRAQLDVTPILRQRNGEAYRSKDTFGDDFRDVRAAIFPGDTRQFLDIRRSANLEADLAGADKADMAKILANAIDTSRFLDETYTPPTVAKAREVAGKRAQGRAKLAAELIRTRNR